MDVDAVSGGNEKEEDEQREPDWANSLGTNTRQGGVGKAGAGGKTGGQAGVSGAGTGDRFAGAWSRCWGFGDFYRACPSGSGRKPPQRQKQSL